MMFESNPNGSSLPSTEDGAHTSNSHRLRCVCGHCKACLDKPLETAQQVSASDAPPGLSVNVSNTLRPPVLRKAQRLARACAPLAKPAGASPSPSSRAGVRPALRKDQLRRTTLRDVLAAGYTADEMASATFKTIKSAVARFERLAGDPPVVDITMETTLKFFEQLVRQRSSDRSVTWNLLALSSVVLRGKDRGLLPDLACPFDDCLQGMRIRTRLSAEPHQLLEADLRQLFSSDLYQNGHPSPTDPMAGRFWAPLAGFLTGARPSELARMTVSDLERHDDAWVLRVRPARDDVSTLKARGGRLIPVHPELVRCGFIAYVAQRKLAGHTTLFRVTSGSASAAQASSSLCRWFARYAQRISLRPRLRTVRSLRFSFMHACAVSGLGGGACCKLTGVRHRRCEAEFELAYGTNRERASAFLVYCFSHLQFDGLDLSHLYVDDPMAGVARAFPTAATQ